VAHSHYAGFIMNLNMHYNTKPNLPGEHHFDSKSFYLLEQKKQKKKMLVENKEIGISL
jgi:hypothetical protein